MAFIAVGTGQVAGLRDAEGHVLAEHIILLALLFGVQLAIDTGDFVVVTREILPGHVELISRCRLHDSLLSYLSCGGGSVSFHLGGTEHKIQFYRELNSFLFIFPAEVGA